MQPASARSLAATMRSQARARERLARRRREPAARSQHFGQPLHRARQRGGLDLHRSMGEHRLPVARPRFQAIGVGHFVAEINMGGRLGLNPPQLAEEREPRDVALVEVRTVRGDGRIDRFEVHGFLSYLNGRNALFVILSAGRSRRITRGDSRGASSLAPRVILRLRASRSAQDDNPGASGRVTHPAFVPPRFAAARTGRRAFTSPSPPRSRPWRSPCGPSGPSGTGRRTRTPCRRRT